MTKTTTLQGLQRIRSLNNEGVKIGTIRKVAIRYIGFDVLCMLIIRVKEIETSHRRESNTLTI